MTMTYFLITAISTLFLFSLFGYFIAKKREKEREVERNKAEKTGGLRAILPLIKWTTNAQAMVIITLLAALVIVLFWAPIKEALGKYPLVITGMIIAMAILLIGGNPEKTISKVRTIALVTLIGSFLIFVIWPAHIGPITKRVFDSSPKKAAPNKSTAQLQQHGKPVSRLIETGITLMPGDSLRVTKDSSTPAIPIILRFPDGQEFDFPASFWGTRQMNYSHTGKAGIQPATIFYQGEAGKYHFEKNPAKTNSSAIVPAIYHPPSSAGKQSAQREECPFN